MKRPYLFMSGEYKVSMGAVFSTNNWQHTVTPERLRVKETRLFRPSRQERLDGIILYADVQDKSIEAININRVIATQTPCWPNPYALRAMLDRHVVLDECVRAGFVGHKVYQTRKPSWTVLHDMFKTGFVIKSGLEHRGEGKHLVRKQSDMPDLAAAGLVSVEPYFQGTSVRALVIGEDVFGIRVENDTSWIKNTAGADVFEFELDPELRLHAIACAKHFNLDVAGVDYIVDSKKFHFLEVNQYPGVSGFDHIMDSARRFFLKKMKEIEAK